MKICIYPDLGESNYYIKNIIGQLKDEAEFISFRDMIKKPWVFFSVDYFFLNWFENQKSKKIILVYLEFLLKRIFILISRVFRKKIIWTFHNKIPHDSNNAQIIKDFMVFLCKYSNKIIIHSKETYKYINLKKDTINRKVVYIPHGNYIGNYKESNENLRDKYNVDDDDLVFMFLGQIKKYKNIELLINAFNKCNFNKEKLIIVGNCKSIEYQNELRKLSNNDNIIFDFKFIDDDDMVKYLNTADVLVLPYDIESSLNSGTIIMAFSYKKTVISPKIGTLKDINKDFYYTYKYSSSKEHLYELINKMKDVSYDYKNYNILCKKGEEAFEYVRKELDWGILHLKDKYLD